MSLTIKTFVFNAFQVNTYVIFNAQHDCMLVDPACYTPKEQEQLSGFIAENKLVIRYLINTHAHVDHILGNSFVFGKYGIAPMMHQDGIVFYDGMEMYARNFGFELEEAPHPGSFLEDGQTLMLGDTPLLISSTPGHADGSVCIINAADRWIISGDLLFQMSIGRTDLPTGNLEKLLHSIRSKVFIYEDGFTVYPGHGNPTTIGFERKNNPYL